MSGPSLAAPSRWLLARRSGLSSGLVQIGQRPIIKPNFILAAGGISRHSFDGRRLSHNACAVERATPRAFARERTDIFPSSSAAHKSFRVSQSLQPKSALK
jgi:hypothetical protein